MAYLKIPHIITSHPDIAHLRTAPLPALIRALPNTHTKNNETIHHISIMRSYNPQNPDNEQRYERNLGHITIKKYKRKIYPRITFCPTRIGHHAHIILDPAYSLNDIAAFAQHLFPPCPMPSAHEHIPYYIHHGYIGGVLPNIMIHIASPGHDRLDTIKRSPVYAKIDIDGKICIYNRTKSQRINKPIAVFNPRYPITCHQGNHEQFFMRVQEHIAGHNQYSHHQRIELLRWAQAPNRLHHIEQMLTTIWREKFNVWPYLDENKHGNLHHPIPRNIIPPHATPTELTP